MTVNERLKLTRVLHLKLTHPACVNAGLYCLIDVSEGCP